MEFFKGFKITLQNRHFLKLAAATFLVFNGFTMIAGLGPYVIIFYVCGGDRSWAPSTLESLARPYPSARLALFICGNASGRHLGQETGVYVVHIDCDRGLWAQMVLLSAGVAAPHPSSRALIAFGLGGLFTTVLSMIADVCDEDEQENGHRREGTFGAIYWWMVKLGTAVALAISGYLLNVTGFCSIGRISCPDAALDAGLRDRSSDRWPTRPPSA